MFDPLLPAEAQAEARGASRAHRSTCRRIQHIRQHDKPPPFGGPRVREVDAEVGRARAEARAEGYRQAERDAAGLRRDLRAKMRDFEEELATLRSGAKKLRDMVMHQIPGSTQALEIVTELEQRAGTLERSLRSFRVRLRR